MVNPRLQLSYVCVAIALEFPVAALEPRLELAIIADSNGSRKHSPPVHLVVLPLAPVHIAIGGGVLSTKVIFLQLGY